MNAARLTIRNKTAKLQRLSVECSSLRNKLKWARHRNAESALNHRLTFKAMADRIRTLENRLKEYES